MHNKWNEHIEAEMQKPYFQKLREYVKSQQAIKQIYPDNNLIFNAFEQTSYYDLKVVILGGEPDNNGSAHGLAWSTTRQDIPDALFNIFKEVRKDVFPEFDNKDMVIHKSGNLTSWANQGVLLLNQVLTSEKGVKDSHKNKGWEEFCKNTIIALNSHPNRVVFMLWGKGACEYTELIDKKHLVLEGSHPSSYTAQNGFFGERFFTRSNEFVLKEYKKTRLPVKWHIH